MKKISKIKNSLILIAMLTLIVIGVHFLLRGKTELEFKTIRKMVYIPAGHFSMGTTNSNDKVPVNRIAVTAFWMDKFEVTNKDFEKFMPEHKKFRKLASNKDEQPVVHVTWKDACDYCDWRCDIEKVPRGTYRLPTEAEWEYAARGGLVQKKFPWGNLSPDFQDIQLANYKSENFSNSFCKTVGSFPPNGFGLYDIAGNVREWCLDQFIPFKKNNHSGKSKTKKVWRGGSWGSEINDLQCDARGGFPRDQWLDNLGFRCVRVE